MFRSPKNNFPFAYIIFSNQSEALSAIEYYDSHKKKLQGAIIPLKAKQAEYKKDKDCRGIYLSSIKRKTTVTDLKKIFKEYGKIFLLKVTVSKKYYTKSAVIFFRK